MCDLVSWDIKYGANNHWLLLGFLPVVLVLRRKMTPKAE